MLDIVISEPQEVWKPGDEISGVVKASYNKPMSVRQITVSMKGEAKCRFGIPELASMHSENCVLVKQDIDLLPHPVMLGEAVSSWPFKFILPDTSDERESTFREPSRLYSNSSIQPLPPSFIVPRKETASSQDTCSIKYGIHVSIDNGKLRSNFGKNEGLDASWFFKFMPDRMGASVDWKMTSKKCNFECRTPLLGASGASKKSFSLKDKVLTTIKSSSLPCAKFSILMSIPKAVVIGQPIPLFVFLQHDDTSSTTSNRPAVELKSCDVKLESLTGIRGHVENYHGNQYQPASHSSWTKITELGSFSGTLPLEDVTDLRLHLDLRVPDSSVQSFSTFNMARAYTIKIQAVVECAKEKFKANFELYPVALLASHVVDAENPPGIGARPSIVSKPSDTSELPTWEESGGYNGLVPLAEKEELPPGYV